jgi:hypothetical protein
MMVGVLAFGALVLDYGVMWVARRQAQNAADAAALAAANVLAFHRFNPGRWDVAREAARVVGQGNSIFGAAPNITQGVGGGGLATEDISFPTCPADASIGPCARVNVYRQDGNNPLPTFFARRGERRQERALPAAICHRRQVG